MVSQGLDLRWWLLTKLAPIQNLNAIYLGSLLLFFFFFLFLTILPRRNNFIRDNKLKNFLLSDFLYVLALIAFVVAARWPALLAPMLNVDEPYFLAAATKLLKEPVYWRVTNTTTSGPLNIYPLLLPGLLGLKLEYAAGRIIGLIAVCVSLSSLYFALVRLYRKEIIRVALVLPVMTFALLTSKELVHYSSEHISVALLSIVLMMITRYFVSFNATKNAGGVFLIGLLLGMIPYAKLQALPIAFCLFCIFTHILYSKRLLRAQLVKSLSCLVLGGSTFSALVAIFLVYFSVTDIFWHSYIKQNLFFSNFSSGLKDRFMGFRQLGRAVLSRPARELIPLFCMTIIIACLSIPVLFKNRRKMKEETTEQGKGVSKTFVFLYYAIALVAMAFYAVAQPQRPFQHYLLFMIIPCSFLLGVLLAELDLLGPEIKVSKRPTPKRKQALLALGGLFGLYQLGGVIIGGNPYIQERQTAIETYLNPVSKAILIHASPGEAMAVWGWSPWLFVETCLVHSGLESVPLWAFRPNPQQDYFVHQFVDGMKQSNARLFLDVMVPGNLAYDWLGVKGIKFEDIPEISEYVHREFTLAEEVAGTKIYVRKRP
jgi:hypothetical protein